MLDYHHLKKNSLSYAGKEILLSFFGICVVIIIGTLGYSIIEKWSLFDSFYMTVITLSTVGFSETHELSFHGRIFTIILIFIGVGVAMALLTTLARAIIERQVNWLFKGNYMEKEIQALKSHIIICGYSRLSHLAIAELSEKNEKVVIIENLPNKVEEAKSAGLLVVQGDATKDDILIQAGIKEASQLVSLLPKDSDNLYVALTVKELNPDVNLIVRGEDDPGIKRLIRAGANKIISPYIAGGQKIADGLLRPYVTEFLDLVLPSNAGDLAIEEILVPSNSSIINKSLIESKIREKSNIIVAAIINPDGKMEYNPSGTAIIQENDTLICLGSKDNFKKMGELIQS